jgi:dipeptidase
MLLLCSLLFSAESNEQVSEKCEFNCFSVMAGKNATVDGSVMFAHNEDDYGDQLVNWYIVPAQKHKQGEALIMRHGGTLPQPDQTWSYLWLEMPGMEFSDSYMNEWGVTIGSDQCISREENPELTDGGIGYELREVMAARAKTAREAVKIGGALVGQFGYTDSGRTYCIADANEAWMLSVVNGKHWVAQRIPDNEVAIIPNYYTINSINLKDTINFYGSADLVSYAENKGWFNPDHEAVFSFRKAYGDPGNLTNMGNLIRHWSAINLMAEREYKVDDEFPFSFEPKQKVTLNLLFTILRNHNEGSDYDESKGYTLGDPHGYVRAICSPATQYGFVAQLRSNLPQEIAFVIWIAPFRPCVQPFIPWYSGITEIPEGYSTGDYQTARKNQFIEIENIRGESSRDHKFLEYVDYANQMDENYRLEIESIRKKTGEMENDLIQNQKEFENRVISEIETDFSAGLELITKYTQHQLERSEKIMKSK